MSKIKNGGLDQSGAGPFEQQQFGTAGVERVKYPLQARWCLKRRNCCQRNVNVTHAVAYLHFHLPTFIDPEN